VGHTSVFGIVYIKT